jgi:hypothetical protein
MKGIKCVQCAKTKVKWFFLVSLKGISSGQIGSAWEWWYHWIGLEKDINRYIFLIFSISLLNIWKDFKFLSRFMQKWIQPPAYCLFGSRFVQNPFFLLAGALLFYKKNPPKCCTILVWSAGCWNSSNILPMTCNPKKNCWLFCIFGARFDGKYCGLCPYKPWSKQAEGWIHFCMKRLRTLKSFKIFKMKI